MPEVVRLRTGRQPLVGRDAAVAALVGAFDDAAQGVGGGIFVTGEPGIGKTRLVEELTDLARQRGACVNWSACRESDGAPAFWPWVQVIRSCRQHVCAPAPEMNPRIEDALALVDEPIGTAEPLGDQARFKLFDSMATLLTNSCASSPLLIVLDDLQWADLPSLHFLSFLLPMLRSHRILLVGTSREPELEAGGDAATLLLDVMRGSPVIALGGLRREGVEELLSSTTGGATADDLVDVVYERSRGNPLFVSELARLLATRGASGAAIDTAVPDGIRAVIERRLARLSQRCHELLGAASVLGEEFGVDVLEPVTGQTRPRVLELLDEGVRNRLVMASDGPGFHFRFSHALVRDAVYESLTLGRRIDLHDRAATTLEALGGAEDDRIAELAFHAFRASPGGNVARAVDFCERAGRRARERLAYEQAAHHFHTALEVLEMVGPEPDRRTALLLELGEALMSSGDVPTARVVFTSAADLARSRGRPVDLARSALGFAAGLDGFEIRLFDEAQIALLEEALAALPETDSEMRARLLARLSVALSFVESRERRHDLTTAAVEMARRIGEPVVLAQALAARCDAIADPDHVEERLAATTEIVDLAVAARDPATELLGRRMRLVAHLELGDTAAAAAEIEAFGRTADLLRQPVYSWYVPMWRGYLALAQGRFDECLVWNAEAEEIGARAHSVNAEVLTRTQRLAMHLRRAEYQEVEAVQKHVIGVLGDLGPEGDVYLAIAEALNGRRGRWDDLDHPGVVDVMDFGAEWLIGMCVMSMACIRTGTAETAAEVYDRLLPHARLFVVDGIGAGPYGSVHHWLGRLAEFLGRDAAAARHLEDAQEAHRRARMSPLTFDGLDVASSTAQGPFAGNVFRHEGDAWTVGYAGVTVSLRDLKGLHDLAQLLAAPGKEIAAVDLASMRGGNLAREGLHAPGDAGEILDARARRAYEHRIREVQEEIDEAEAHHDSERRARSEAELDALVDQLSSAVGLGGRARKAGDPAEKARTAVTWRIRNAIDRVEKAHPALGRHLSKSVRTGTFCAYDPEGPIDWEL